MKSKVFKCKNLCKQMGYSLVEIVVVLAISSLFIVMVSKIMTQFSTDAITTQDSLGQASDISVIFNWLQKNGIKKNLTIYGFTGSNTTVNGLAKAIIPFPNTCGDLKSSCPDHSAYLLPYVDWKRSPLLTAICALDQNRVIVDLSYDNFGSATKIADGFNIAALNNLPAGKIKIVDKSLLLFINDPEATLFIATGPPNAYNPTFNATTGLYGDAIFAANPTCIKYTKDPAKLYIIPIRPYLLPNSGTTTPDSRLILSSMGNFPIRITQGRFFALGRNPNDTINKINGGRWGLRWCDELSPFACDSRDEVLFVNSNSKIDIFQYFQTGLGGNPFSTRYSIGKSSKCSDGTCENLSYPSVVRFSEDLETLVSLDSTKFSYIKQNMIDKIEFQVEDRSGGRDSLGKYSKESGIIRRYYLENL